MTWTEAVNVYLSTHREATARRYRSVLEEFAACSVVSAKLRRGARARPPD